MDEGEKSKERNHCFNLKWSNHSDPRTQKLETTPAADLPQPIKSLDDVRNRKRASSPIPSLCRSGQTLNEEDEDYPRYAQTSMKGSRAVSIGRNIRGVALRSRRRMTLARMNVSMKQSISGLGRKARKVIPSIRVRDVNLIDKYSRIVFPVCFVVFNLFYWGYYSMLTAYV
ncbi:unnamed protein product [Caenorhabditis auriculariae]|uniref:Neurotransmitter-gated ion-channel transmembrane domain-containing protein n=1 Tax=Caenorhabditis auriculariae TaxID=2777116 RepID=A0A8S1HP86_9PELO|nr:unnamed protein product [Caenorhabditis auriculariae]